MKMLSLDDAIKAVTMLLDDTDGIDKIRSCDVINNLKYAPSVEEIEPAQKWISVKDRLPELATLALVCDASSGKMAVARYIANNQWVLPAFFPAVTHWMLLPEPPKEDVDDA